MTTEEQPRDDWQHWHDRCLNACRLSCRHFHCTGKGSLARWAHRCKLVDVEPPPPVCGIVGCGRRSTTRILAGYRCEAHTPDQPQRRDPIVATPVVEPLSYGHATTDPLGRDGDGWVLDDRTKLPKRAPSDG